MQQSALSSLADVAEYRDKRVDDQHKYGAKQDAERDEPAFVGRISVQQPDDAACDEQRLHRRNR